MEDSTTVSPPENNPPYEASRAWHPAWRPEKDDHLQTDKHVTNNDGLGDLGGAEGGNLEPGLLENSIDEREASLEFNAQPDPFLHSPSPILSTPVSLHRGHGLDSKESHNEEATIGFADNEADVGEKVEDEESLPIIGAEKNALSLPPSQPPAEGGGQDAIQKESVPIGLQQEHDAGQPLSLQRVSSFPEVPPFESASSITKIHPFSHTQAEEIIDAIEGDRTPPESVPSMTSMPHSSTHDPFEDLPMGQTDDFFGHVNGEHQESSLFQAEQADFEESQPLVLTEKRGSDANGVPAQLNLDDAFGTLGPEDDFYAQVSGAKPTLVDALDNADTQSNDSSQELNNNNVHSHCSIKEVSSTEDVRPSLEDLTGGGIAVSASTIVSQVVLEGLDKPSTLPSGDSLAQIEPTEEELVAKWEAALGDDDLLDDEPEVDPSAFFEDDGEGFLDDEPNTIDSAMFSPPSLQPVTGPDGQFQGFNNISTQRGTFPNKYIPSQSLANSHVLQRQLSPYASASPTPSDGLLLSRGPEASSRENAQIFSSGPIASTEAKSLYDLPFDVTRPKKRPERLQDFTPAPPQPPPRTSSISNAAGSPDFGTLQLTSSSQTVRAKPSTSSFFEELPMTAKRPSVIQRSFTHNPTSPVAPAPPPQLRPQASTGSFFEELAPAPKPRPSGNLGRTPSYAPNLLSPLALASQLPSQPPQQSRPNTLSQPPTIDSRMPSLPPESQLVAPQKMPLFESQSISSLPPQTAPAMQARYSPAPPPTTQSANRNRYAASAAPPRPSSVSLGMPHQPRTSSPLARSASTSHQETLPPEEDPLSKQQQVLQMNGPPRPSLRTTQTSQYPPSPRVNSVFAPDERDLSARKLSRSVEEPEPSNFARAYHHPLEQTHALTPNSHASEAREFNAPPRSRTSSPTSSAQQFKPPPPLDYATISRTASFNDLNAFPRNAPPAPYTSHGSLSQPRPSQTPLPENDLILPTDGREHDPLQRWRGAPIFNFGLGGHTVSSFPKQIPMFTSGSVKTLKKCLPGEVKLDTSTFMELDERIVSFPGPLRSKGKKKEVVDWLNKSIARLSQQLMALGPMQIPAEIQQRHSEKILLWKILRVMVENDGALEGSASSVKAVQAVLSHQDIGQEGSQSLLPLSHESSPLQRSVFRSVTSRGNQHTEDPGALENLHQLLLQGEREKAIWLAVDQHLWGHAMLICSTLEKEIWKQIVQEFVRQEVRANCQNTESMAALYAVFAGNWEESVDQLVPPSARAGFQMISKSPSSGPAKNALEGLDCWQETLILILSNRSTDDQNAIAALGRLLMTYGRVEAAHVCFLFSRSQIAFSGADETQEGIVLLGTDHRHQPFDFGRDIDGVLLTEVYEFATTVLAPSPFSTALPHLQSFKLQQAISLAEAGHRDKAMSYCDALQSITKSTTKPSPYYHKYFVSQLNDFNDRLRQVPKESNASWIARPSMEGVSGSVWNKFTKFVQGDDSDAASASSGKEMDNDPKPFAGVTDTPVISRDPSPNSSYGSYPNGSAFGAGQYAPSKTNSKYAPPSTHTPLSVPDQSLQVNQLRLDVPPLSHEPVRQGPLRKQPSYASMPKSSPDFSRKPHSEAYQPALPSANSYSSATLPRPDSSSSTPSRGGYNPYMPNHSPLPPSQLHTTFPSKAGPSIDEQVSSPPAQYSLAIFEQTGLQRSFSEASELSPTTVPPVSSHYVTSPKPAQASLANQGPSSEMYNHLDERSQIPTPSFGYESPSAGSYEPPGANSYNPGSSPYEPPAASSYDAPAMPSHDLGTSSYDPGLSSYEPPADSSHISGGDSPVDLKPKRSFMDDDDETDLAAKAAALKAQEKARKNREADEAFRKAAEADAQKDKLVAAKSSWLGGWFGGKGKDLSSSAQPAPQANKPIRARLGEESSFVYDKELKKWVNKKAGAAAPETPSATPPPPRGPPPPSRMASGMGGPPMSMSRAVSGMGGPPPSMGIVGTGLGAPKTSSPLAASTATADLSNLSSATPQSTATPPIATGSPAPPGTANSLIQTSLQPPSSSSSPGPAGKPPSAPPSRPSTSMGGGMGEVLDDLLGPPLAGGRRAGGTVKRGKKGRYVDIMAKGD